jgi:hypothetical protein
MKRWSQKSGANIDVRHYSLVTISMYDSLLSKKKTTHAKRNASSQSQSPFFPQTTFFWSIPKVYSVQEDAEGMERFLERKKAVNNDEPRTHDAN